MVKKGIMVTVLSLLMALAMIVVAPVFAQGSWTMSDDAGFGGGANNISARPMIIYGGELYVAASNFTTGAEVWKKGTGDTWSQVNTDGFGSAQNIVVGGFAELGGDLYAGTLNGTPDVGCRVFRYDGGTTWTQVNTTGFGNVYNSAVTAMEVYDGYLYAAVSNGYTDTSNIFAPTFVTTGGEIWRSANGTTWTQVGSGGLGSINNSGFGVLKAYNGNLYAGTMKMDISVAVIGLIQLRVTTTSLGCELHEYDGSSWTKIDDLGFTDVDNIAVSAVCEYEGDLLLGTSNNEPIVIDSPVFGFDMDAAKLWGHQLLSHMQALDLTGFTPYTTAGAYIYTYDGSTVTEWVAGGDFAEGDFGIMALETYDHTCGDVLLASLGCGDDLARMKAYVGGAWEDGAPDYFGDTGNNTFSTFMPFGGEMYVGTLNITAGCEMWRGQPPLNAGTIEGNVTAEVGGAALSNITVYIWNGTTDVLVDTQTTDGSGDYSATLCPGTYKVQFMDLGGTYAKEWYDNQPRRPYPANVTVTKGGTTTCDASLASGGTIAGTISSELGGGIANIWVYVYDGTTNAFTNRFSLTDGSGDYSLLMPVGDYKVRFVDRNMNYLNEWYDDSPTRPPTANVNVTAGNTETLNASLTPIGTISGTVDAEGGGGIAGVRVFVYDGTTNAYIGCSGKTDGTGDYTIHKVPEGNYKVRFVDYSLVYWSEWYDNSPTRPPTANVTVTGGGTTALNAELAPR